MKIYTVEILKEYENGEKNSKGFLMEGDKPAVFETIELAVRTAHIAVNMLNAHMYTKWEFKVKEGHTL